MKLAYDAKLKRPGCVLLQAALGGDRSLAHRFPVDTWLLSPTPDMRVYEITREQLPQLIAMTLSTTEQPK